MIGSRLVPRDLRDLLASLAREARMIPAASGAVEEERPDFEESVDRALKRSLALSHATFRQPIRIRFPRPAYFQEGTEEG